MEMGDSVHTLDKVKKSYRQQNLLLLNSHCEAIFKVIMRSRIEIQIESPVSGSKFFVPSRYLHLFKLRLINDNRSSRFRKISNVILIKIRKSLKRKFKNVLI